MITNLWPHQQTALDLLRQSVKSGHRRPMLNLATGSGKTKLAASIIESAVKKGGRVAFTVPAISLVDQTISTLWNEGIRDVGVIQAQHHLTDWDQPIQIASVQTLARRKKFPEATLVIVDEAHEQFDIIKQWMTDPDSHNIVFIGLSATPGSKGLGNYYDDLIIPTTVETLIEQGFLAGFKTYARATGDYSKVNIVKGDYDESKLSQIMSDPALVANVVTTWLQEAQNRPTIAFGVDRVHAKAIQQEFLSAGVKCAYIDAYTPLPERNEIGRQLKAREIQVVSNVWTLGVGVDWDVRCVICGRPTKSKMRWVQLIGRGLRVAEGKDYLLILDHTKNSTTMGEVTDIHFTKLDKSHKGEKQQVENIPTESLPKACQKCGFLKPPKVHICPACGHIPSKANNHEHADGMLIEVMKKKKGFQIESEAIFFGQLKYYAREKGKADKWASGLFKAKTEKWPDHVRHAPEVKPTAETLRWITSRGIAWSAVKRKQKAQANG